MLSILHRFESLRQTRGGSTAPATPEHTTGATQPSPTTPPPSSSDDHSSAERITLQHSVTQPNGTTPLPTQQGESVVADGPAPITHDTTGTPVTNTPTRIIAGLLTLFGYNPHTTTPNPTPAQPALLFVWAAWQQLNRRYLNSTPQLNPASHTIDTTTGTITGNLNATDPDGDTLTYTLTKAPDHGTLTLAPNGTYTYTPNPDYAHQLAADPTLPTTDTFTITATDGHTHTHSATPQNGNTTTITVPITAHNQAPTLTVVSVVHNDDNTTTYVVAPADADNDDIAITVATQPAHGTLTATPGTGGTVTLTYTPDPAYAHQLAADATLDATDTFALSATDGHGGTVTTTLTPTITPQNQAPQVDLTHEVVPYQENWAIYFFTRGDADGDTLTTTVSQPTHGTAVLFTDGANFSVHYTADPDYAHELAIDPSLPNTDSIVVTTADGHGGTTIHTITTTISATNQPPSTTVVSEVHNTDNSTTYVFAPVDPDGDPVSATVTYSPLNGTVVITPNQDGTITVIYTPNPEFAHEISTPGGPTPHDPFLITFDDGLGGTSQVSLRPTINATNQAPTATNTMVMASVPQWTTVSLGSIAGDRQMNPGINGAATSADGRYLYIVDNRYTGHLVVFDTTTQSVVERIPVGVHPQAVSLSPDGTTVYVSNFGSTVSVIDLVTNTVTRTIPTAGDPGEVVVSPDGNWVYVTNRTTRVVSKINTSTGAVTTFPLHVTDVSPRTLAISRDGSTLYVQTLGGNIVVMDATTGTVRQRIPATASATGMEVSPDGKTLYAAAATGVVHVIDTATNTIVRTIPVDGMTLATALSPDGSTLYVTTTAGRVNVIDTATGTVVGSLPTPGQGTSDSNDITLSPDGTKLYVGSTYNAEVRTYTGPVSSGVITATDADGDVLTYTVTTAPTHGTVVVNPSTGTWTYTGDTPGVNRPDSFVVTVTDGDGGSTAVPITLNAASNA